MATTRTKGVLEWRAQRQREVEHNVHGKTRSGAQESMSRVKHLASHIERTLTGPMWHGPALNELLDGITAERASMHPVAGAHSIWEIVLHVTAWSEIASARLHGDRVGDPTPEQDWPAVSATGAGDWTAARQQLEMAHRQLAEKVRRFDETRLDERIPGLEYSPSILLHGIVEHGTYHGGQIALLKKA
jgi:uncharacterized damage-inducible protein DinB